MNKKQDGRTSAKNVVTEKIDALLNSEERNVKRLDSEHLEIHESKYKVLTDYRDALDLEMLELRYSNLLEKYDYIVGDMSYGNLRLRGFYSDNNRKAPIDMRIGSLEDYLLEYCSFGCAYFVLESLDPKRKSIQQANQGKPSRASKPSRQQTKPKTEQSKKKPFKKKQTQTQAKRKRQAKPTTKPARESTKPRAKAQEEKRSFVKKSRTEPKEVKKENERVKKVKSEKGSTRFKIRKKED